MNTLAKAAASRQARDWASLPSGLLQHIFCETSTWQAPGSCLAAPVCHTWRTAAAGCEVTHLLYLAGHPVADKSFGTWLKGNSHRLEALVLSSDNHNANTALLHALAEAAAAAMAAGRPLALHTLRVLGPGLELDVTGRLLEGLPNLTRLQLQPQSKPESYDSQKAASKDLAHLKTAMQLEELYITGPPSDIVTLQQVADLLPASLKRLSWTTIDCTKPAPNLAHLKRLTFLRLEDWCALLTWPLSVLLPTGLQQLELGGLFLPPSMLREQQELLTGFHGLFLLGDELQVQCSWTKLRSLEGVWASNFRRPQVCAALQQLVKLSVLEVRARATGQDLQRAVSAAAGLQGLRRLHMEVPDLLQMSGQLAALTRLTHLKVFFREQQHEQDQQQLEQQRGWAAEVGRMSWLRWLSVPVQLLAADQGWLGGLEQLQVLVLSGVEVSPAGVTQQVVQWLEKCDLQQLPPRLLLLGLTGITAEQAAAWQVRRRLQQRLSSGGCEVVFGVDLDEVCDPVKQLAGLPAELQQALG